MTQQFPEILIFEGIRVAMPFYPPIPENHPRIIKVSREEVMKTDAMLLSTGCWRQYVGAWEIKDDRLFLIGLQGIYRLEGEEPLFADWFTGVLKLPPKGMFWFYMKGIGSIQENEYHIRVEKGVVIRSNRPNHPAKKFEGSESGEKNLPER